LLIIRTFALQNLANFGFYGYNSEDILPVCLFAEVRSDSNILSFFTLVRTISM
jgi:hypothetical protein